MSDLRNESEIKLKEIPKFQFEINNDELTNCIKELAFSLKTQDKNIQKIKKELEVKTAENQVSEAFVFVNSLIEIDPTLTKTIKTKPSKKDDPNTSILTKSSGELGRKINQMSEIMAYFHNNFKNLEKKVSDLEFSSKSSLNEKVNMLQEQVDDTNSKIYNEVHSLTKKFELNMSEFSDKVREVETKTVWQINDCKVRLNSSINEQYVKDSMKEVEGRMITRMKEQSIKQGNIDPDRIQKIEQQLLKNEKEFGSSLTETNYKITSLKDNIEKTMMSKQQFADEKIESEKKLGILNSNISDLTRRLRHNEVETTEHKESLSKISVFNENCDKEMKRMNGIMNNLKLGDDFQKILQKIDPHKICDLDTKVDGLLLDNEKLSTYIDLLRKQIDRVRSKNEFCGMLTPNNGTPGQKMSKEEILQIINQFFVNNNFSKKLQGLQAQLIELRGFPELINEVNKKMARLQKDSDQHNITYELRGLQEYMKKENLIMNNRINQLEIMLNEEKKKRPSSAGRNLGDSRLGSSVSYKKLTPVNCISCYTGDKKSLARRL